MTGQAYTASAAPTRPTEQRRPDTASPLAPFAVAALCVLALAAVWAVAELVPAAHLRDATALYDFTKLSRPRLDSLLEGLLALLDPAQFVLWGVALAAVAIAEERPRTAAAVVLILALAPFTAEQLKPLLAHRHDHVGGISIGPASWPSGHSTAAAALAMCAVLVSPPRLRRGVAVAGALFVAAVCVALLVLAWHMPSDVLGGILVAAMWTALAVAGLRLSERVRPSEAARAPTG